MTMPQLSLKKTRTECNNTDAGKMPLGRYCGIC